MKLLLDQNLSHKLIQQLSDVYPGAVHVRDVGLESADDEAVWEYAKQNGLVILSKDADFRQRSFLYGHPPKAVWVRVGNCSTQDIESFLRASAPRLSAFLEDKEGSFLILDR